MKPISNRQLMAIAAICVVALGAVLLGLVFPQKIKKPAAPNITPVATSTPAAILAPPAETKVQSPARKTIGLSVEGRAIETYTFGSGGTPLVFIGGMHGGYEWNSVLLAYEFIDYFGQKPEVIPENLTVTVIPDANPDGMFEVIGKEGRFTAADVPAGTNSGGRLNANGVDLNRNFACNWKAQGVWKNQPVSGGTSPFSEPESAAIRDFIVENKPAGVIFWHSQSNAIYGSQCGGDMLAKTQEIMDVYSKASGYKTVATFDQYSVTGDATDWLASINIPAMTVELKTHASIDWEKNLAGTKALFEYYGNKK